MQWMVDGLIGLTPPHVLWPVAALVELRSKHGHVTTHCRQGQGLPVTGTQCRTSHVPTTTHAQVLFDIWWSCVHDTSAVGILQCKISRNGGHATEGLQHFIHLYAGPTNGGFGTWQDTSGGCSVTCGGGTRTEERLCDTPAPANGGLNCTGDYVRQLECNNQSCPRE